MTRRDLFRALLALPLAAALPWRPRRVIVIPKRVLYTRIRITREVIEASRGGPGMFVRAIDEELGAIARHLQMDDARWLATDGRVLQRCYDGDAYTATLHIGGHR
jgi:hypothetical protein